MLLKFSTLDLLDLNMLSVDHVKSRSDYSSHVIQRIVTWLDLSSWSGFHTNKLALSFNGIMTSVVIIIVVSLINRCHNY